MSKQSDLLKVEDPNYNRPSHRTARFIMVIFGWFKDIFTSSTTIIPRGEVLQHFRNHLPPGKAVCYSNILLVEDNPHTARKFIGALEDFYEMGSIKILVAYAYDAAITFFDNEEISLVIMDADLEDDDGDGVDLTQQFLKKKPDLEILANSSSKISNLKLTGFGATGNLGKNPDKLKDWLKVNDPAGGGI